MGIWMAGLLCVAGWGPGEGGLPAQLKDEEGLTSITGVATLRAGVWTGNDFAFKAVRTDSTQASSGNQALFSVGVMGGIEIASHLLILASFEGDFASKVSSDIVGAYLGWREHPKERYGHGVPDSVTIYAGGIAGNIKVHEPDFGSFDRGYGFSGGISLGWDLSAKWGIDLIGEYRYIKFDYNRDVLSGDTSIGGNAAWVGAGLTFRF